VEIAEGRTCQDIESDRVRGTHRTHLLETAEGEVRTWEESGRARGTHPLETAEGVHAKCFGVEILEIIALSRQCQDIETERKRLLMRVRMLWLRLGFKG